MIVKVLKDFTTWDASGKVVGEAGKVMDVLDYTGERLIQMQLVADPDAEPAEKPTRKRKKRADKSEE